MALAACIEVPGNSIASSARGRAAAAERAERDRLARELAVLRQTDGQLELEIAQAKAAGVQAAATLRAVQSDLNLQLARLQQAEQNLVAAHARGRQIETELAPLRELEGQLAAQASLREVAAARLAQGAAEITAASLQVAQLEGELVAKLAALQQKLVACKQLADALEGIERTLAEAIHAAVPPPVVAPPAVAPAVPPPTVTPAAAVPAVK